MHLTHLVAELLTRRVDASHDREKHGPIHWFVGRLGGRRRRGRGDEAGPEGCGLRGDVSLGLRQRVHKRLEEALVRHALPRAQMEAIIKAEELDDVRHGGLDAEGEQAGLELGAVDGAGFPSVHGSEDGVQGGYDVLTRAPKLQELKVDGFMELGGHPLSSGL